MTKQIVTHELQDTGKLSIMIRADDEHITISMISLTPDRSIHMSEEMARAFADAIYEAFHLRARLALAAGKTEKPHQGGTPDTAMDDQSDPF